MILQSYRLLPYLDYLDDIQNRQQLLFEVIPMEAEVWKPVPNYEGLYEVSNLGEVRSIDRICVNSKGVSRRLKGKLIKFDYCSGNYVFVALWKNDNCYKIRVSELVASVFMPEYDGRPVYHKNQNFKDNRLSNLTLTVPDVVNPFDGLDFNIFDCKDEVWKVVEGFEDYYISSRGRLLSCSKYIKSKDVRYAYRKARIVEFDPACVTYYEITLHKSNGSTCDKLIHRLVAETFIPNPNNLPYINHIDANIHNNDVSNLEWCDPKHNAQHAAGLGLLNWDVTNRVHETPVFCKTLNKYFRSIAEASRTLGIKYEHLQERLARGRHLINGFYFEYADK